MNAPFFIDRGPEPPGFPWHSYAPGVWTKINRDRRHLGLTKETAPCSRGFDKNFTYLAGCGNHFNNEPQLDDTTFKLAALCSDGLWMEGDSFLDRKKDIPKDFYSTTYFTDKMIDILEARDEQEKEKPFLAYLAYTAPHWPLQAPQEDIAKYRGMYDDGPEALRERRLQGLVSRGLIPADVVPAPMIGSEPKEWDEKNDEERVLSSRRMETYSAMVHLMDVQLQRVIDYLASTDELDNTFVVFMSDNGAEGKELEALPILSGSPLTRVVAKYYNNSLENIGNADSFVWYGTRWAAAATAPSRGFKTYTFEGGIRCPCILRYPALARSGGGAVSHEFTTCMDILPTMLQLAGVEHPHPTFHGREVAAPRGRSWVPYLSQEADSVHRDDTTVTGWELFGRRAIRRGNYKAVFTPAPAGSDEWELYDIPSDPGEVNDLAGAKPEVLQSLLRDWSQYVQETGLYDIKLNLAANPHATVPKKE